MNNRSNLKVIFCLIIGVILSIWSYHPGLGGSFIFDDYSNIFDNDLLKAGHFSIEDLWQASLSSNSGPLRRPVAMFSFAINHVLTGMDPYWMKFTNLGIHIFNGFLLFLVLQQLFSSLYKNNDKYASMVPPLITIIWLVHPINVTVVSYIVQRMTSLSATFVLLALYCYLKLRDGKLLNWRGYLLSISILFLWLIGLLTKETAISLSIYVFVIEWCVYGFKTDSKGEKRHLGILWTLLAAPWVCAFIYVIYDPSIILAGYAYQEFTLVERILTESRIVIDYLRLIIIPDIRHMGLFHDDVILSKSLFDPISTMLSMLLIIGLFVLAIRIRKEAPLFCLGVFWFFGGHVLESSVYPLELVFLHRNYLPSIGIILVLLEVGCVLFQNYRTIAITTVCAVVLGFSICTRFLAYQWSGDPKMLLIEVINNPNSVRANIVAGQVYSDFAIATPAGRQRDEYKRVARKYFRKIRKFDQGDVFGELSILAMFLQMKEIPPQSLVEELIQVFPTAKVKMRTISIFLSIELCLIRKECFLQAGEFQRLIEALLSNPELLAQQKGQLLGNYAVYIFYNENNLDKAISIILKAINSDPSNLALYTLLISYYGEKGNTEDMKRTIDTLEGKDKLGQFRKFIKQANENYSIN